MLGPTMVIPLLLCLVAATSAYDRLPKDAHPIKYSLTLRPNMKTFTYQGSLNVLLVLNNTDTFSLDSHGLKIDNGTTLTYGFLPVPHTTQLIGNRLVVKTIQDLAPTHNVSFTINFNGSIRSDLSGFYLSRYHYNGTQRYLASTQFENSGARKAFPCFDEPSFRADFQLELELESGWSAMSNTPILSDNTTAGVRRIKFSEQKNIPVYLVAWVIFEAEGFGGRSIDTPGCAGQPNIKYGIWSNKQFQNEYDIALNAAPLIVQKLENFTGIKCKAVKDKVDLVAIPDFSAGAMENWGLITFRESLLLYDRSYSTALDMQQIITVVAHELAHQWFGNLVTPQWWSCTWLSEGFARYLQFFITHQFLPELRLDEQFVVDRRQLALETDTENSHPLTNNNLTTPSDLDDMFDVITYDKGASVIHMLRSLIGSSNFSSGINRYLTTVDGLGGVTSPDLFFSSFPPELQQLRSWTETSGYPVIVASEKDSTLVLSQIKVLSWKQTTPSHWLVPISIGVRNTTSWHYLQPNGTLVVPIDSSSPYLINVDQTGYYRVWYANQSRWLLGDAKPLARSQLIDDIMALAYAGLVPYDDAISVTSYHLQRCNDYLTWRTGLRQLSKLSSLLDGTPLQSNFTEEILSWMTGVVDYIAFNDTEGLTPPHKLHQMNILKHACKFGHEGCLKAASQLALNISNSSPEKRSALLCTVVMQGNDTTWQYILDQYNASKSPAQSQLMLNALTCTTNRTLIRRLLNLLTTDSIRRHDVVSVISLISSTQVGAEEAFSFIKNNSKKIYERFGESRTVQKIFASATNFATDSQLAELRQLAKTTVVPGLDLGPLVKSLEKSIWWKNNVRWSLRSYLTGEPIPTSVSDGTGPGTSMTASQSSINNHKSFRLWRLTIISIIVLYFSA